MKRSEREKEEKMAEVPASTESHISARTAEAPAKVKTTASAGNPPGANTVSGPRRIVLIGMLVSLAIALSFLERLIPFPQLAPGVKLGLANIVTLLSVLVLSFNETLLITVLRCMITSALFGGISLFLFSLTGGVFSVIVMWLLGRRFAGSFSVPAVSIAGAVFHNMGQLTVAALLLDTFGLLSYLPILIVSGAVTGYFVGIIVKQLIKFLKVTGYFRQE